MEGDDPPPLHEARRAGVGAKRRSGPSGRAVPPFLNVILVGSPK